MFRRRLVAINTFIIVLAICFLTFTSVKRMRELFYLESAMVYETQIEKSFEELSAVFADAERFLLNICASQELGEHLLNHCTEDTWSKEESLKLNEILSRKYSDMGRYTVNIMPVNEKGEILSFNQSTGAYEKTDKNIEDYPVNRDFLWQSSVGQGTISVVRKIFDINKAVNTVAVVHMEINMSTVSVAFNKYNYRGQSHNMYLLNGDEDIIYPYYYPGRLIIEDSLGEKNSITYALKDQKITITRTFRQNGWILVDVVEGSALLAGSKDLINRLFIYGFILVVLTTGFTYLATRLMTDPILKLARQMKKTCKTEVYEEIAVNNNSYEVKALYESFNDLIRTTKSSMDEIRRGAERERKNQFLMLQAQINPHFIYNTLDAVGWIAMKYGAYEIQDIVVYLVGMFRNSINYEGTLIQIRGEIEHVRYYINIMQMRYPDMYTARFDVDEELEGYWVIRQILQPLAENAIQHGIYESGIPGIIKIKVFMEDTFLVMQVSNNGKPVDLEKVRSILNSPEDDKIPHFGIRNANERLKKYYGDGCGLNFEIEGELTVVTAKIPLSKIKDNNIGDTING